VTGRCSRIPQRRPKRPHRVGEHVLGEPDQTRQAILPQHLALLVQLAVGVPHGVCLSLKRGNGGAQGLHHPSLPGSGDAVRPRLADLAKVGSGSAYRTVTLRHAGGTVALNPLTQEPTENG
jgi:hypothetical protein